MYIKTNGKHHQELIIYILNECCSLCNEVNIHQLFHFIRRLREHRCLINSKRSISACDFHRHVFLRFCHTRWCDWDLETTTNFTYTFYYHSFIFYVWVFTFLSLATRTWFIGFRVKRFQQNFILHSPLNFLFAFRSISITIKFTSKWFAIGNEFKHTIS